MFHIPDRKVLQDLPIPSEEALHSLIVRGEYLLRCSFLHDHAAFHEDHAVGDISRKRHLVGDDHHGDI